ncbi:hypothetical protein DMENIID0001_060850 [Sergentomyia squamirostris]
MSEPADCSLLVIVLDTNPCQRIIRTNIHHMTQCLDSIVAFGNAHLMQRAQNKLAVLACHHHATEFLYPTPGKPMDVRQIDGQYELFTLVEKTVKTKMTDLITNLIFLTSTFTTLDPIFASNFCTFLTHKHLMNNFSLFSTRYTGIKCGFSLIEIF